MKEIKMIKTYLDTVSRFEYMKYEFKFEDKYIMGCACYYKKNSTVAVVIADDYDCTVTVKFYEGRRLIYERKG